MTITEWWALAGRLESTQAAVTAWPQLTKQDQGKIREAVQRAQAAAEPHLQELGRWIAAVIAEADFDRIIDSWPSGGKLSEHLELELAASQHLGRPLEPGEPVPGCGCPACTGIPADHPVRTRMHQRLQATLDAQRWARRSDPDARAAWEAQKAAAKAASIVRIGERLGLGPVEGHGKQVRVRCPFHDDEHPSLSLNEEKGLWYCPVCAEGGDGVGLYMRAKGVTFAAAVRELANA